MFTGIVQQVGKVRDVRKSSSGLALSIDIGPLASGLAAGDSVAVNGACLTAAELAGQVAAFDVMRQTLDLTTLGQLRPGARVNLERALRLDQGLDGHLVQGHIDGVATVRAIQTAGRHVVEFSADAALTGLMVPQGSVAVDGVSLTVADVSAGRFSVALIPTTLERTTLGDLKVGSKVNVETDIIGKYVLRFLKALPQPGGGITMQQLKEAGFM